MNHSPRRIQQSGEHPLVPPSGHPKRAYSSAVDWLLPHGRSGDIAGPGPDISGAGSLGRALDSGLRTAGGRIG